MDMVFFSLVSIVLGIFLVFFYAVLKPHCVSKIKTAIIVSLLVWFIAEF